MKAPARIAVIAFIVILVAVVFAAKQSRENSAPVAAPAATTPDAPLEAASAGSVPIAEADIASSDSVLSSPVAQLIDLGSVGCIPCDMMAPILEELKKEYEGRLSVAFIDVKQMPEMARVYSIQLIPTQIFLNSEGEELYRHEGFMSKEDILAKWDELGIDL